MHSLPPNVFPREILEASKTQQLIKDFSQIKNPVQLMQEFQASEQASEFYRILIEYIKEFDEQLDQEHEVGIQLVSFGHSIQFAVRDIGYCNPKLITFVGELEDGSKVQLVQHVNQLSFLLLAVPRKNPEKPKYPLGFCLDKQTDSEAESACSQSTEEV